jgi:hypothetical protein
MSPPPVPIPPPTIHSQHVTTFNLNCEEAEALASQLADTPKWFIKILLKYWQQMKDYHPTPKH